jgi:ethanolamine-phosphate cytidylyltransferase
VTGVNSDVGIMAVKGPSVLNDEERCLIIESCKFVKEIKRSTPYLCDEALLDTYNCQYYCHGDDPAIGVDGIDMCETMASHGRFK